ncbi:MAG: PAS domain S-box protein, partial [Flavobacteriales bacterium]|nr:PAS domain S-box protein [Flavobacteriales bacterium]
GDVLISTDRQGLYRLTRSGNSWTHAPVNLPIEIISVSAIYEDDNNIIWIGTMGTGVYRISEESMDKITIPKKYEAHYITCIYEDVNGAILFGSWANGLVKYNGISFEKVDESGGLQGNQIESLFADDEGLIWIGTHGNGIQLLEGLEFVFYSKEHGLAGSNIRGLALNDDGDLWVSTLKGLSKITSGTVDSAVVIDGISNKFGPIINFQNNEMLVGTYNGDLVQINQKYGYQIISFEELKLAEIITMEAYHGGALIGTLQHGLYFYNGKSLRRIDVNKELSDVQIWTISTRDQQTYLGTNKGVVVIDSIGQFSYPGKDRRELATSKITSSSFFENYLMITTDSRGLWRMDLETGEFMHLQTDEGISSNQIFSSEWLDENNLMLTNHMGLDRVRFFNNHHVVESYHVDFGDGLEFNTNVTLKGSGEEFWVGSNEGLLLYNPSKAVNFLKQPDLHVHGVKIMQEDVDWSSQEAHLDANRIPVEFTLPYDQNYITFSYQGIHFSEYENVRYQSRLLGRDEIWGQYNLNNEATYSNLPNGEYTFEVRCSIDGGKTLSETQSIHFFILPPFYKTWWFFSLLVIGILFVIYSFSQAFKKVQSQTVNYSTLQQSIGANRLMLFFIGISYPIVMVINSYLDAKIIDPQLMVSISIGTVTIVILGMSFYQVRVRKILGTLVMIVFISIEAHILALLVANNIAVSMIIGFVMTTSFASVVFNTLRDYIIFALSVFLFVILIALNNETAEFNRFQFVMVGFWTLMIVSLLIIVKVNLFRKLRLSDTILEKGDSIILVRNDKGNIIYASSSIEEKLGYPLDQVYGEGWWKLREQQDGILKHEIIGDVEYTAGSRIYTNEIHDISGERKFFNWTDTKIEGGLVIGVGQDVTSLRESQKELEKLSIIASKTDSGVILMDADNKVEWINEAFEEITGFSFSEFKGKRPGDLIAGPDTNNKKIEQSRSERYKMKTYQMELLSYKKSGEPIWISINHTPIFKEGTKELQWQVNMVQNITEAKDRQEEMKRLSMVATKTDNYVLITDKNDKVLWVNNAFEKIFKFPIDEVIGKTTASFLKTAEFNPQIIKKLAKTVFTNKEPFVGELTEVDANGDHIWVAVNITPIIDKDGEIEQVISLGTDITDKKLDEFRLNEYSKSLELKHDIDNVFLDDESEEKMFHKLLRVVKGSNSLYSRISLMIYNNELEVLDNYYIDEINGPISYEKELKMERFRSVEQLKSKEMYIVHELENDLVSGSDRELYDIGARTYVMVPMVVGNKVVGSLNIGGKYPFMFTDEEVQVIKDIASSLSVAYRQREQANQIIESEDNFRQLNESLKEVFWLFDQEKGKMIYVNQAYETIFGSTTESLFNDPLSWMKAIFPEDRTRVQRAYLDNVFGDGFDEQFQITHPKDGMKWVHSTAVPIKNESGEVLKISGFTEDITELKLKEHELSYLNAKLESISSINESILRNEPFGTVLIESLKGLVSDQFEIFRLTLALFDFENDELSFFRIDNEMKSVSGGSEKYPMSYFQHIKNLRKGESVVVDVMTDLSKQSDSDKKLLELGTKSYILVPLISDRELIGSLNLAFNVPGPFEKDFVDGLRDVANGISLSIHQMQLKSIIEDDKEELVQKNRNITASINYAKRIQNAYLPELDFIKKFFTEAFLYYRAKDIVSGDFYWWTLKNNKLIMVVADCTGHGVPGGFMTILGSQTIANIVNGKNITDPGLLLKVLDLEIQHALNKSDEELRDGMDVAVCTIDLVTNELTYAGARRPLMYITENEFFEIKGTPRSIGEDDSVSSHYVTTNIQLRKGDRLFMFSDGVQDQFGGGGRPRKFSKLRLQNMIMNKDNLNSSMADHFGDIVDSLEEWKGDREQTDDMILLALEF